MEYEISERKFIYSALNPFNPSVLSKLIIFLWLTLFKYEIVSEDGHSRYKYLLIVKLQLNESDQNVISVPTL